MGLACGGLGERAPSGADVQIGSAPETPHVIDSQAEINSSLPGFRASLGTLGMTLKDTGVSDRALRQPELPLGAVPRGN